MLNRIIFLVIAVALTWMGYICLNAERWGPIFTGYVLLTLGIALFSITIYCWIEHVLYIQEQIRNDQDDRDPY